MKSMLKSEPAFESLAGALLDVNKYVEERSRDAALRVVQDLESLAQLQYWTWVNPSDDMSAEDRLRVANTIKLDIAKGLLSTLHGEGGKVLRAAVAKDAPEMLERFDVALTESIKRLDDYRLFALFILDEPEPEVDDDFVIIYPDVPPGPSVDLEL